MLTTNTTKSGSQWYVERKLNVNSMASIFLKNVTEYLKPKNIKLFDYVSYKLGKVRFGYVRLG